MKDFLIDSNTVYEKGMQGYTALTIIEENLNRLEELLKEASNEINKHDELNRMYYQSLESDIQYLRDYKNKYQSFIGGTYNVNGDGGFVGEYKDTVDDPYYKQKEALLDKLGDLKLEDITVDNKLGITTNMQAFVGHTTTIKDKVNIRDILGFGNISDNIKKQYEESKALIEKYNAGLNTYNEADYPSILPGFAKKLWYNLTKKKEKTIDNYDDYLDAIIKSGDFNFETEGEKKLSIGLDFIPILGIEKMTLEGLLGEDLVSGKDLNGLERILAVAPAGVGALSKVKNAIKLGEVGGKVEGSISFGMNGGGQLEDILSKLKKSKAEEDMVAKEAVTIDKGAADAKYTTKIKWGINDIEARPFGKGFWGKRIPQKNTRVDDFELKINPNDESFYLPHPNGGYVQFENLAEDIVQDGKLIIKQKSFYHVEDLPEFAQNKVIQEAMRQVDSAKAAGYKVEWLVSEEKAVNQLTRLFERENIDITVKYYPE